SGMDGPWPYGDIPIIVATTRPLPDPPCAVVSHSGEIASLLGKAQQLAGAKDVYVDGGDMVRQALAANLVDELIITVVPTALGQGISLFAGLDAEHPMTVHRVAKYADGLVQLHLTPRPSAP
ncbi:MAG: dihydrofolate reductase family protein, partial [Demequina sp.]